MDFYKANCVSVNSDIVFDQTAIKIGPIVLRKTVATSLDGESMTKRGVMFVARRIPKEEMIKCLDVSN